MRSLASRRRKFQTELWRQQDPGKLCGPKHVRFMHLDDELHTRFGIGILDLAGYYIAGRFTPILTTTDVETMMARLRERHGANLDQFKTLDNALSAEPAEVGQ